MADRFPSLEDIDAGQTEVRGASADDGDFLARERAILGEDADMFGGGNETRQTTVEDGGDDDLLGGNFGGSSNDQHGAQFDDFDTFESSFPAVDNTNANIGPGGTITGSTLPYHPPTTSYTSGYALGEQQEDSEPIRAWREKRDAELARRDEASAKKKEETISTARKDIDSFYESYNRKTDRQKTSTAKEAEEFLAKREDTTSGGTSWERIAKLSDLSGKGHSGGGAGSSKQKMREMLLNLSKDSNAPGASGI